VEYALDKADWQRQDQADLRFLPAEFPEPVIVDAEMVADLVEVLGQPVQIRADHLLEAARLDVDHHLIVPPPRAGTAAWLTCDEGGSPTGSPARDLRRVTRRSCVTPEAVA
jgi:hypothetical protein